MGIFNFKDYQKKYKENIDVNNYKHHMLIENLSSLISNIKSNKDIMCNQESELFKDLLKIYKNDKDKLLKSLELEIKIKKESLIDSVSKILYKNYPEYLKDKYSKCFYEVCCDITSNEDQSGVVPNRGVISSSGMGDLGCDIHIAKDLNGDVIAIKIISIRKNEYFTFKENSRFDNLLD